MSRVECTVSESFYPGKVSLVIYYGKDFEGNDLARSFDLTPIQAVDLALALTAKANKVEDTQYLLNRAGIA